MNILYHGGEVVSTRSTAETEALDKRGYHYVWFVPDKENTSRTDLYELDIIKPKDNLLLPYQIWKILRKKNIKLLMTAIMGYPKRTIMVVLLAKVLGIPNIVALCGSDARLYHKRGLKSKIFARIVLRFTDYVTCLHPAIKRAAIKNKLFDSNKTVVVHNGVKVRPLHSVDRKEKVVLYMNRFIWWKRPMILVDSIPYVLTEVPEARFIFLGAGKYPEQEKKCYHRVNQLGLANKVDFQDFVHNVSPYLEKASVFANPSKWAYIDNSLLETMERGIPPVVAEGPDVKKIIEHGKNGFICEPEPDSFADAIIKLLKDEKLRQRMGWEARKTIEREYDARIVAEKYIKLFEKVAKKR